MTMDRLIAFAASVLLAIGGAGTGGAHASPLDRGVSLGPTTQTPLSPVSQQNAIRAAYSYLDVMPFSHDGLIQQLVSIDGYSPADATFAVSSITVDWNEQAAKAAAGYLDVMPFSRDGLVTQLTSIDGYTYAQAAYGVSTTGL